jgi:hypothetical protein
MDTQVTHPFRKRIGWLIVAATVLVFLIAGGAYLLRPYSRAQYVLGQLGALHVGRSGFAEAQEVASRIGAAPSDPCGSNECYWRIRVDNLNLPEQWRGPGASLGVGFEVKNSVVSEKGFAFQIGSGMGSPSVQVHEQPPSRGMPTKPVFVETQASAEVPHYRAFVNLMPDAPADVRKQYFSANLTCFWKYHGCHDAQELLQVIEWK